MRKHRLLQSSWLLLLTILILGAIAAPASAGNAHAQAQAGTPIPSTVYITNASLRPLFQDTIDSQVPVAVNGAINNVVGSLPIQNQGWARQMASTVLQPSASLTGLTPQQAGMIASLRLSLYDGDPRPITAQTLVKFSVLDTSTIQVNAVPLAGSPTLVSGPLTTLQVPFGQLDSIHTTPACGDAGLAIGLRLPILPGSKTGMGLVNPFQSGNHIGAALQTNSKTILQPAAASMGAYIELPANSLAMLGNSIGSLQINSNLTAQNIQVGVVGGQLQITTDISLGGALTLGKATTTVAPMAASGNLAVHVQQTQMTIFQFFTFPYNNYNQQIEQSLNSKLNNALAGRFSVNQAMIGPNSHVPCAANDSLVLAGTTMTG